MRSPKAVVTPTRKNSSAQRLTNALKQQLAGARGLTRQEQGRNQEAAADLSYAARLYKEAGASDLAKELEQVPGK